MQCRNPPLIDGNTKPGAAPPFCQHSTVVTAERIAGELGVPNSALAHLLRVGHAATLTIKGH